MQALFLSLLAAAELLEGDDQMSAFCLYCLEYRMVPCVLLKISTRLFFFLSFIWVTRLSLSLPFSDIQTKAEP